VNYNEALAFLEGHINLEVLRVGKHELPSLDRMVEFMGLMGNPQHLAPAVHITGTNGKGSTARIVTALVAEHNLSVGTYTSPHLERVNDRIGRNGIATTDDEFAAAISSVAEVLDLVPLAPSYFEVLVAAAFSWFEEVAVDVAVVEVGLGGTWDATNVVDGTVSVVTNVGLDHVDYIGPTRADIAREKSGIIKPNSTVVLGERDPELKAIFAEKPSERMLVAGEDFELTANEVAVGGRLLSIETPWTTYEDLFVPLHGRHQGENTLTAIVATEAFFGRAFDPEVLQEGLAGVTNPGRFEVLGHSPLVLVDGAHNPDGAHAAALTLREDFAIGGDLILVVGTNNGHDARDILEALDARQARVVVATAADWQRAIPAEEVADAAKALGCAVEIESRVSDAVDRAMSLAGVDDTVLVCGSLYVVGEARSKLLARGLDSGI
jgi:dihydrofolate synthase / folylpolyglutamate synthase